LDLFNSATKTWRFSTAKTKTCYWTWTWTISD